MSRAYIVTRNGGTVTKAPINDNKIPIYPNETALDADLANIPDNTLVATKGGHDDVINQMKAYIRNQNVLSDYESITISTDSNNPTVMRYDGILSIFQGYGSSMRVSVYVNGVLISIAGGNDLTLSQSLSFKKNDEIYLSIKGGGVTQYVSYYKDRDYTGR